MFLINKILKLILILTIVFLVSINLGGAYSNNTVSKKSLLKRIIEKFWVKDDLPEAKEINDNIKMLVSGGSFPSWSYLNGKITYTKKVKDQYEIYTINPDGNNDKCLTIGKADLKNCGHRRQSFWHPSGKYIVFSAENSLYTRKGMEITHRFGNGRNFNVWIMTSDGNKFWKITDYPENWGVIGTKFSNSGNMIFWNEEFSMEKYPKGKPEDRVPNPGSYWDLNNYQYRRGEELGLWRIVFGSLTFDIDEPEVTNIRKIKPPLELTLIKANSFKPGDNGFICSFAPYKETMSTALWGEIYTTNIAGKYLNRMTYSIWNHEEEPIYSPDYKYIAFTKATKRQGKPMDGTEIFLIKVDGGESVKLTHFSDYDFPEYSEDWLHITGMSWSPDGKKIVFGMARIDRNVPGRYIASDLYILTIPSEYLTP